MIVTFCNGKGGSGKTTLTILIASALAEAGHDVAVQDLDPQRTATLWSAETKSVRIAAPGERAAALLIDTPPRLDSADVHQAMKRADAVVVVSSPSPADLFTSRDTAELAKTLGVKPKSRLLFNQVQANTLLARDLDDLGERIGLVPLRNRICRRQAYQHAVVMGWKSLPIEAREEVYRVALEITGLVK